MRRATARQIGLPAVTLTVFVAGVILDAGNAVRINDHAGTQIGLTVACTTVGSFLVARRPDVVIGWLFAVAGLGAALTYMSAEYVARSLITSPGSLPWPKGPFLVGTSTWIISIALLAVFAVLFFPDGRLPSKRWRPVAWLGAAGLAAAVAGKVALGLMSSIDDVVEKPPSDGAAAVALGIHVWGFRLLTLVGLIAVGSLAVRARTAPPPHRQAMRWYGGAAALLTASFHLDLLRYALPFELPFHELGSDLEAVGYPLLAVALGTAVFAFDVYDLDVVLSRTLLYATLTVFGVAVYVVSVWAVSAAIGARAEIAPVLATGVVAVLAQPARVRLQSLIDRRLFGLRDDPLEMLSRLTKHLETSGGAGLLDGLTATVASTMRLPYVAIQPISGPVSAVGQPRGDVDRWPLVAAGEAVGWLEVASRTRVDPLTPRERHVIAGLAPQLAVAVRSLRLTEELVASRAALLLAVEDERRRLRNDLHDGVGPTLASVVLGLDGVSGNLAADRPDLSEWVGRLSSEVHAVVDEIRRLVYGLRPPTLDDLGLHGAITEHVRSLSRSEAATIEIETTGDLSDLPAAVEVAAYRIVLEGLTNAMLHSQGSLCRIRLHADADLTVSVTDDGVGLDGQRAGVGLQSMHRRAEEVGGSLTIGPGPSGAGTTVAACLPIIDALVRAP